MAFPPHQGYDRGVILDERALARFQTKVARQPNGCLKWTGATASGYGRFYLNDKLRPAHVVAWEHYNCTEVPQGMDVGHQCHDRDKGCQGGITCPHRACVEPSHLMPMTRQDNIRAGRTVTDTCPQGHPASARRNGRCRICHNANNGARRKAAKTRCPKGHRYTGKNLGQDKNGRRFCLQCAREQAALMRASRPTKASIIR
jgi:hypothetical protein